MPRRYDSEYPPLYGTVDRVVLTVRGGKVQSLHAGRGQAPYAGQLANGVESRGDPPAHLPCLSSPPAPNSVGEQADSSGRAIVAAHTGTVLPWSECQRTVGGRVYGWFMAESATVEELRRRLDEVQSRHEADSAAAAKAFWRSLRPPVAGSRKGGAWTRRSFVPVARGPWAHVRPGDAAAVAPRDAVWVDGPEDDRRWPDAPGAAAASVAWWVDEGARRAPEQPDPVTVKIDAATSRPLDRHGDHEVMTAAEQVAALRGQHDVMLVNLVAELEVRGVESPGGLSRTDWLRSLDPGMTAGQAKAFVTVGRAIVDARWSALGTQVAVQHVTVGKAAQIIDFHERTAPAADPDDVATAVDDLTEQAARLTPEELGRLVRHHSEQVRPPRDEERLDAGRQAARGLWFAPPNASGMVAMRATLDPEAAAILKSAVDPLSVPTPTKDYHGKTIERDARTPARRRADALLQIVQRGVASAEHLPSTDKAKLVVTIDHDVLTGTAEGTGLTTTGEVLSPATVRRLACDSAIVPMVLGSQSEPLDLGREKRLVTKGLRLALWQRDGGCSFPGCTIPPSWCDAHHVVPWYLGGTTSVLTTALLCRRHHTHVHREGLTASVTVVGVTWHV